MASDKCSGGMQRTIEQDEHAVGSGGHTLKMEVGTKRVCWAVRNVVSMISGSCRPIAHHSIVPYGDRHPGPVIKTQCNKASSLAPCGGQRRRRFRAREGAVDKRGTSVHMKNPSVFLLPRLHVKPVAVVEIDKLTFLPLAW